MSIPINLGSLSRIQGFSLSRRLTSALSVFAGAAAAYSLRIPAGCPYGGPLIRVRRSSDNAEQNFAAVAVADSNGNRWVDTAAVLSFCGAGNGFVTTWYDQSGNGRHVFQATAGNQPQVVANGSLITRGGLPVVYFPSANVTLQTTASGITSYPLSLCSVGGFDNLTTSTLRVVHFGASWNGFQFDLLQGSVWVRKMNIISMIVVPSIQTAMVSNVITLTQPSPTGNTRVFINGTVRNPLQGEGVVPSTPSPTLTIGGYSTLAFMSELVAFASELTTTSRQALERNQGAAFGITVA